MVTNFFPQLLIQHPELYPTASFRRGMDISYGCGSMTAESRDFKLYPAAGLQLGIGIEYGVDEALAPEKRQGIRVYQVIGLQ